MVDLVPIAGMIFSLLMVLVIGGFVLLYPLSKRLGAVLEMKLEERQGPQVQRVPAAEVEGLRGVLEALQAEVGELAERQEFLERLISGGTGSRREIGGGARASVEGGRDPSPMAGETTAGDAGSELAGP